MLVFLHFANIIVHEKIDEKILGRDGSIKLIQSGAPENGIVCRRAQTMMKMMKNVFNRGGIPTVIGRVISLSAQIDSLLKVTKGVETGF